MRLMRYLILLAVLYSSGCQTAARMNKIRIGMTRNEVIAALGQPMGASAYGTAEYLHYRLPETSNDVLYGIEVPYYVRLINGRVDSYGRVGDFAASVETPKSSAQVQLDAAHEGMKETIYGLCDQEFGAQYRAEAIALADSLVDNGILNPPTTVSEGLELMRACYQIVKTQREKSPEVSSTRDRTGNDNKSPTVPYSQKLKPNAYGPGIHQNQYGQPVTLRPDFGGVPGEQLRIKENAYGPGVHMDQYGRPVREYTWP